MDPLELDSFLNPSAREERGDSTGEHLRPGDSEENVYALLDDRPEHELTPPRGMDTVTGSSYGFGIEIDAGMGSSATPAPAPLSSLTQHADAGAGSEEIDLASGAFERPAARGEGAGSAAMTRDRGVPLPWDGGPEPAARWADALGEQSAEIASSAAVGYESGPGPAFDDAEHARLRERIRRQQRARSGRTAAGTLPSRKRRGLAFLVGGIAVLGAVAGAVLLLVSDRGAAFLDRQIGVVTPQGAARPLDAERQPARERRGVLSIEDRLRRALAFGLPPAAFERGAGRAQQEQAPSFATDAGEGR